MENLLMSIIVSVTGFLIGGILMTIIGSISIKFLVKRVIDTALSDEVKNKVRKWLEEGFKNGIGNALQDDEIRNIILEILKLSEEKLKKEDSKKPKHF